MPADVPIRLVTARPRALEVSLARELAAIRVAEPLAPVVVLVGGILQRTYLQRRLAELNGAVLNVRFVTVGELGLSLGGAALAEQGRVRVSPVVERAYSASVARTQQGDDYFAPVAETPGFAQALRRLFVELRQEGVSPDALATHAPTAAESERKGAAIASLYSAYISGRSGVYDGIDALAAADAVRFDGCALFVYGPWRLPALALAAVEAIAKRVPVTVFLPTVDVTADPAHAELRSWLAARDVAEERAVEAPADGGLGAFQQRLFQPDGPLEVGDAVHLVSAPDPLGEAREAVRTCLDWAAEGIAFHEMAIAYRDGATYAPLLETVLAEAGIPAYIDGGTSFAERPLGRRVIALLDLLGSPLRRADVIAFVTDGGLAEGVAPGPVGASAARWDEASRVAGVVEGIEQWQSRLTAYAARMEATARESDARRAHAARTLLDFVEGLDAAGRPPEDRSSWSVALAYLSGILTRYLADAEVVVDALAPLGALDGVLGGDGVSFDRFLDVVRDQMRAMRQEDVDAGAPGAFARRGINALEVNQLRHVSFRAVAILGLAERAFPPPPRQDPLLLDAERTSLNAVLDATLPLRALGADEEPLQFALAVHAARERLLLSTRRADTVGGRAQLASPFFRLAASAIAGKRLTLQEVNQLPGDAVVRVPAGRIGAGLVARALEMGEYDRTLIEGDPTLGASYLEALEPRTARTSDKRRARWERALTPYDGALADPAALSSLAASLATGTYLSPSRLEAYASCPFSFFADRVLGLRTIDEPDEVLRIEGSTWGTLVHSILERFLGEHGPGRLDPGNRDALHARLAGIAAEVLDGAEAEGLTGTPLLWRRDRAAILTDLREWLDREIAEGLPYEQNLLEVGFGITEGQPPLVLRVGELDLSFRGFVDRLDWDAGGAFRVTDYKTGRNRAKKATGFNGGRALQLPLYLLASAQLVGADPADGRAGYYFITRAQGFARVELAGSELAARRDDLDAVLGQIADGMAGGDFHAEPGDPCRYCDFEAACPVSRKALRERKAGDERLLRFDEMREIE